MSDIADGFTERFYRSVDGLTLYARDYPAPNADPNRLPVVCLPGLTRNSRDFHGIASQLSRASISRRVITLDYRGRGRSERDDNKANYNLAIECNDVITTCAVFGIERAIFIGTSRGGLILHLMAAARPDLVAATILNDIGPVIETKGLMQIRDYLNHGRKLENWDEAVEALKRNHGADFTILSEDDWREMALAIYRKDGGRPVADVDPAIAAQLKAIDFSQPLPDLWPQFDSFCRSPLMVIRGANSSLLSEKTMREMAKRHSRMTGLVAEGQGHAPILHLGNIPAAIQAFVESV